MKSLKLLLSALALCALAASCSEDATDSGVLAPSGIKGEALVFAADTDLSPIVSQEGECLTIRFTAGQRWTTFIADTRAAVDWIHVSPTSGGVGEVVLAITVKRNETIYDREGHVTISVGTSSSSIDITQRQRDALIVSPTEKRVEARETEFDIELRSSLDEEVEVDVQAEWIEQIVTRVMTPTTLSFRAARNPGEERTGTIVIRSGDFSGTVAVTQEKGDFIVDTDRFAVDASPQSISATVRANIDFEAEPQVSWIHYAPTRAMTAHRLVFDIDENTTGAERTGEIVVSSNGKSETITVVQSHEAFGVRFDTTTVPREGGVVTATVDSNVAYDVVLPDDADWIVSDDAAATRAIATQTHSFRIAENAGFETRSAVVAFVFHTEKEELTRQIAITQEPTDFSVAKSLYAIDANGGRVDVYIKSNVLLAAQIACRVTQGSEWIGRATASDTKERLSFTIDKNITGEPREGEVELSFGKTLVSVRVVQSATVEIVDFPDENFRACMVLFFDGNGDGEISVEEAAEITQINCSGLKIQSLEGIQACVSLEVLWCNSNQLTVLDVSQNMALTTLVCSSDCLSALYLGENKVLSYLNCRNNRLTSLDVSKNPALKELFCSNNQLTDLDLSKNSALQQLFCGENLLTTLDVSATNLANSIRPAPFSCAPMPTLQTLYLKTGWSILGINDDRSDKNIPEQTEILYK